MKCRLRQCSASLAAAGSWGCSWGLAELGKSYSSVYKVQTMEYYTKSKPDLKKPSKEAKTLQNKLISKHHHNFVDKLTKNDRLNVKPVELQVNPDKLKQTKPTTHLRPYDVPYHLRKGFEAELLEMLEAGIIEQCTSHTDWNTKAFPVPKSSDPTKCRIVGDFRGLNNILLKLYWHTECREVLVQGPPPGCLQQQCSVEYLD